MKQLLFMLSLLVFSACQTDAPKEAEAAIAGKAVFSGKITNANGGKVKVSSVDQKYEATLDDDGQFSMDIALEEAGTYRLSYGGENAPLYFEPGDAINMTLDTEQFDESLTFTGTGSEENNYLISKFMLAEKEMGENEDFYGAEEADFIKASESLLVLKKQQLSDALTNFPVINKQFASTAKTDLTYDWAIQRQNYQSYHAYYAEAEDFEVSESYNDYLTKLDLNNGALLSSSRYKSFIKSYYGNMADEALESDETLKENEKTGRLQAMFAIIDDKAVAVKEYLMYSNLKDQINYYSTEGIDPFMATFNKLSNDTKHKESLQEAYEKWAALASGKVAPGFTYNNINGEAIALASLKGKNVYIDVWATWCGPCKKEIPHLEKLQEKYEGNNNIVFASVSIDEDKDAWETMVKEKEMKGIQLFADDAWSSSICEDYLIKGIPRFILIGKEGNIIDSRAPRPSSDEIKKVLENLAKPVLTSMK